MSINDYHSPTLASYFQVVLSLNVTTISIVELFIFGWSFSFFIRSADKTCFPLIDTRLTFITRENRLSVVDKIPIRRDSARIRGGRWEGRKKIVSCAIKREIVPLPRRDTWFGAIKIKSSLSLNVSLHAKCNVETLFPKIYRFAPAFDTRIHVYVTYNRTNFMLPSLSASFKNKRTGRRIFSFFLRKIAVLQCFSCISKAFNEASEGETFRRFDCARHESAQLFLGISLEKRWYSNGIKYRTRESWRKRDTALCRPRCGRTACRPFSCPVILGRVARKTRRDASVAKIILPTGPWKILPSLLLFRCAWESSYSLISLCFSSSPARRADENRRRRISAKQRLRQVSGQSGRRSVKRGRPPFGAGEEGMGEFGGRVNG